MQNSKKIVNIWLLFLAGHLRLTSERAETWQEKIHL